MRLIMHILRHHEVKICQIFFARAFGARDLTLCTEASLKMEEAAKHLHERALANLQSIKSNGIPK